MRKDKDQLVGSQEEEIDLTPMLDVVFIMLIFFIVSAVFLNEKGLDLTQSTGQIGSNPPTMDHGV